MYYKFYLILSKYLFEEARKRSLSDIDVEWKFDGPSITLSTVVDWLEEFEKLGLWVASVVVICSGGDSLSKLSSGKNTLAGDWKIFLMSKWRQRFP